MKTAKEWMGYHGESYGMIRIDRVDLEAIQRDAWEAATKAQMEKDGNTKDGEAWELVSFPPEAQ